MATTVFPVPAEPEFSGWPRKTLLHDLLLRGMQENSPLVPRVVEGALEFFDVLKNAEAAQRDWVLERACGDFLRHGRAFGLFADCQGQQGFTGFRGEMPCKVEQCFLRRLPYVNKPILRQAIPQQFIVGATLKEKRQAKRCEHLTIVVRIVPKHANCS